MILEINTNWGIGKFKVKKKNIKLSYSWNLPDLELIFLLTDLQKNVHTVCMFVLQSDKPCVFL